MYPADQARVEIAIEWTNGGTRVVLWVGQVAGDDTIIKETLS